ncbi:hypothetical protein SLS60_001983 [Paraconiothyrium brasiliense]|uniref:MFS transporter n=1 Tax=Paraconiothyrium brasiliense TaxID=300254 RepID=A0ABR3S280_9PLEO
MADEKITSSVEHTSDNGDAFKNNDKEATHIVASWREGTDAEKRLVRKLDWRILPCTWVLYTLGYLDRANIGNAKTGGLERDFGLTDSQYSIIVLLFFVSYLIFEVPANMLLTRVRPSVFLPGLGLLWGTFAALMGSVQNWQQLAGMRFLIGFAEILEGVASICGAILIFFLMPDYPSNSKRFLSEEQMVLACNRLSVDGIALTQGTGSEQIPHWVAFKMAVSDWRVWAQCLLFTLVTGSQTMQYFIPTLVKMFGWSGPSGQYHTIPAYAAALVYVVGSCYLADKFKAKWPLICILSGFGCVLFIVVSVIQNRMAQYVLTIFAFGTIYGCSPLVKTWVSDVIPQPAAKRAVAIALINAIGNASSIYASWLWPNKDAPRYIAGFTTTTSWLGVLCVCTYVFSRLFKKWPVERMDHGENMAAEMRARRERDEKAAAA